MSDPRTMRALAHPVRLALLEALRREGPLTATRAAELLDDSPGNMSWHLQTLAKYGFVEEAGGGRGRSRPWRVVSLTRHVKVEAMSDPEFASAEEALEASLLERAYQRLREWRSGRRSFPAVWLSSAFSTYAVTYLTPEEMKMAWVMRSAPSSRATTPVRSTRRTAPPAHSLRISSPSATLCRLPHPATDTLAGCHKNI